jgi:hypothetical protein
MDIGLRTTDHGQQTTDSALRHLTSFQFVSFSVFSFLARHFFLCFSLNRRNVASKSVGGATVKKNNESRTSKNDSGLNCVFSLSASNDVLRSQEREMSFAHRMGEGVRRTDEGNCVGRMRVVGKKQFNLERAGVRCRIRTLPVNNANYAWIQHFIHHLSPDGKRVGNGN